MDNLVWAELKIRELLERVEKLLKRVEKLERQLEGHSVVTTGVNSPAPSNPLHGYFQRNWTRTPYPVIDHALRIEQNLDGSFHFYIHPQHTSGETLDFIVTETETKLR